MQYVLKQIIEIFQHYRFFLHFLSSFSGCSPRAEHEIDNGPHIDK